MSTFVNMLKDQSGASAAEYALILAIVGSGIAIAAIYLGGKISASLKATGDEIEVCQTATSSTTGC